MPTPIKACCAEFARVSSTRSGNYSVRIRERLRRMVQLRMDRRLGGASTLPTGFRRRSGPARRLAEYIADPAMPSFLWLRFLTAQRLITLHRNHLGVKGRDAGGEVSLHSGPLPSADSRSLAAQLLGRLTTPSRAAIRAEVQIKIQDALNAMDPIDREILALRHLSAQHAKELAAFRSEAEASWPARAMSCPATSSLRRSVNRPADTR